MKKRKLFLMSALLILVFGITAQTKITVRLTGGTNTMRQNATKNVSDFLNAINYAYENNSSINFSNMGITDEAEQNIDSMWDFNPFYCTMSTISEALIKGLNGYELRNIPVVMVDGNGVEKGQEITLEFNEKGSITDLYFSLQQFQYKNIMSTGNDVVEETRRNIVRGFLENMKTAYMRKDIGFIEKIFSDQALIIVGKQIKQTDRKSFSVSTQKEFLSDDPGNTHFKKLTKAEYINNLKRIFNNNKSIFVDFDDIEIVQHRKKGYDAYYGVRLKQDWQSDNYSDSGLLFFVIEFRENEDPLIWVRVWQDANTTDKSQQIGLGEIKIKPKSLNE